MTQIWICLSETNTGTELHHFTDEGRRDQFALAWCETHWRNAWGGMPSVWPTALERITQELESEAALSCFDPIDVAPTSIGSTVDRLMLSAQELQQMRELVRMMQHNANYRALYAKLNAATLEICA